MPLACPFPLRNRQGTTNGKGFSMITAYKTVYLGGQGEITEKKSRFIATIEPVRSEEEAAAFLERTKKNYWNASHNCSAFIIGHENQLTRCSDDGEPGGTAGRPMLDVLLGEGLCDTAVVVTRYFGGTLLGTGGLVRAYSRAVQAGLLEAAVIEKQYARKLEIRTDYNGVGKIQYLLGQAGITTLTSEYTDQVRLEILIPINLVAELQKKLIEGTSGRAVLQPLDACWFALYQGEVLLFPGE